MRIFSAKKAQQMLAHEIKEAGRGGLQERVAHLIQQYRAVLGPIRFYHTWNSQRSAPGFPDCVIVIPGYRRTIFAELKSEDGKLTTEQAGWLRDLAACGDEVYVWRPSHLIRGKIAEVLSAAGTDDHGRVW